MKIPKMFPIIPKTYKYIKRIAKLKTVNNRHIVQFSTTNKIKFNLSIYHFIYVELHTEIVFNDQIMSVINPYVEMKNVTNDTIINLFALINIQI